MFAIVLETWWLSRQASNCKHIWKHFQQKLWTAGETNCCYTPRESSNIWATLSHCIQHTAPQWNDVQLGIMIMLLPGGYGPCGVYAYQSYHCYCLGFFLCFFSFRIFSHKTSKIPLRNSWWPIGSCLSSLRCNDSSGPNRCISSWTKRWQGVWTHWKAPGPITVLRWCWWELVVSCHIHHELSCFVPNCCKLPKVGEWQILSCQSIAAQDPWMQHQAVFIHWGHRTHMK